MVSQEVRSVNRWPTVEQLHVDTRLRRADTVFIMGMFVPGRAKDGKQDFYCGVRGCGETTRTDPTPTPKCRLHGVPMKKGKKLLKR